MDCGVENGGPASSVDSYQQPGEFTPVQEWPDPLNVTGCEDPRFRFEPDIELQPTDRHSGAPTGLDVHLEVPQRNDEVKERRRTVRPERQREGDRHAADQEDGDHAARRA